MNFTEHAGKAVLQAAGIPTPKGILVRTAAEAADAARKMVERALARMADHMNAVR